MKKFEIKRAAEVMGAKCSRGISGCFSGVCTDSRMIKEGDCFFAIKGERFDGHDFIEAVLEKSAAFAVVEENWKGDIAEERLLRVGDTVAALGKLAAEYRRVLGSRVVGGTGSGGKTTTRQIIYEVLSRSYKTGQSPKNFNNHIGLPLAILGAEADKEVLVLELGTSSPGEISYLSKIAQPDIAVVTNVYPAHLEGFGTVERIAKEKLSIADGLSKDGTVIINGDIELLTQTCREAGREFISFGVKDGCDVIAKNIEHIESGSRFVIEGQKIEVSLHGRGNIENCLAAWAVCRQMGISIEDFAEAVRYIKPVGMRGEVLRFGKAIILNDCYNANPASMRNALEVLGRLDGDGARKVFICGDMFELGKDSERLHAELGQQAAESGVDLLVTVGKLSRHTGEAAGCCGNGIEIKNFTDSKSARDNLQNFVRNTDIILVKGSRASRLEVIVDSLKELLAQG
ncbi:MAG: UDP-N-acetylmuramoyl-tripeptide--D-alanyl-D-alanine ligase [Phycisphaerae bacterium]|nr:UDP-N-acetylmuramoyl-tripeptide--D-alanyl-D-alanine ligase [Phycisphaerae bacterium]